MKLKAPLILASGSPRRHELLRDAGFEFEIVLREVEERIPTNIHANGVAVYLSEFKAKAYLDLTEENIIITADTIVVLDDKILGKPANEEEAFQMLKKLSGNLHEVVSGVTITHKGKLNSFSEITSVRFNKLEDEVIRTYIKNENPLDKAGSYGIQDSIGKIGISEIEGDFYNVMGLPVSSLYKELKKYR